MSQTIEAVIDQLGNISLLTRVRLKGKRRALVTILDEEPTSPNVKPPINEKVSDTDVLSVWANRKEPPQEIADQLRKRNRITI